MRVGRLVGRTFELGRLAEAREASRASRGSVVALVGEPGIGKSRLALEAASEAAEAGMRVSWGRCWEAGGAPVGWPWREALRSLLEGPGDPAIEAIGHRRRWLASLLPELGGAERAESDPATARFLACDAVAALLEAVAQRAPLALLLEDMHAADGHSAEILRFVARSARAWPLHLVCTWREAGASDEVAAHLAAVSRDATVLALPPLARAEARELARERAAGGWAEDDLARVVDAAGGNPLFLEELAATRAAFGPSGTLPRVVEDALDAHLRSVSSDALEVARLAAVFGRRVPTGPLRRAARELLVLSPEALAGALRELTAARLLVEERADEWIFRHILVRDVLARGIEPARRAELHAGVLSTLEELAAPASELAHHALEAVPALPPTEAARYAHTAAREATATLAFEGAVQILTRAVELLDEAGLSADAHAVELRVVLAHALIHAGRVADGKKVCEHAAAIAERIGAVELLARAALTHGIEYTLGTTDRAMIDLLERALAALGEEPTPLRARVLARYATALYPHRDLRVPVATAREAIDLARRLGDPATLLEVIDRARLPLVLSASSAEIGPLQEEALVLAREHGDEWQRMLSLAMVAFARVGLGDVRGAEAAVAEACLIGERFSQPQQRFRLHLLRSMLAARAGRWAEWERHVADGRAWLERGPVTPAIRIFDLHRFAVLRHRRDREILTTEQKHYEELLGRYPSRYALVGWVAALSGDHAGARAQLADRDALLWGRPPAIQALLAEIAIALEDSELCAELYELLLPRAGETLYWGMIAAAAEGAIDAWLGRLSVALGDLDRADRHFEQAVAIDARSGCRPGEAHALADWGRALLAHRPAHRARAHELLERAARLYDELELPLRAAEARDAIAAGPVSRSGPVVGAAPPRLLFTREGATMAVEYGSDVVRVPDGKGLRYLEHLVARPGTEISAVELVGLAGEPVPESVARSDAGEVLDEKARRAYAARLRDLREELEEAEGFDDLGRASAAREEIAALERQLRAALGLGGRVKRSGSMAERARVNVQRRLRSAIAALAKVHPALGAHLRRSVRTGSSCIYDPPLVF